MWDGDLPSSSDADLVARAMDADRAAFAAIYDRYADRLYDFCWSLLRNRDDAADATQDTFVRAAERLAQLRDPSMLRSWLYSIAKRESLARLRARRRQIPDDAVPDTPDVSTGPESQAHQSELRDLVWDAAAGLAERDRVLLNLHLRHGLDGAELADAAGIQANNVYMMLGRFRERVERSLGALLVARLGRAECAELDTILTDWDGKFSVLIRKRVARHVDACDICGERRRAAASPVALLSTVPIMTAPPELREIVLRAFDADSTSGDGDADAGAGTDGSEPSGMGWWRGHPVRTGTLITAGAGAVTAAVIVGAMSLSPPGETQTLAPGPLTTTKPPATSAPDPGAGPNTRDLGIGGFGEMTPGATSDPGPEESIPPVDPEPTDDTTPVTEDPADAELVASAQLVDLGAQEPVQAVMLSNTGELALSYSVASQTPWLSTDHAAGQLPGGSDRELMIIADRADLDEGDFEGSVVVASSAGDVTITVSLSVEHPPVIEQAGATPATLFVSPCDADTAAVGALVADESEIDNVYLVWTGAEGGTEQMTLRSGSWYADLGPIGEPGTVTWHIEATDVRGNTGTSREQSITAEPCQIVE